MCACCQLGERRNLLLNRWFQSYGNAAAISQVHNKCQDHPEFRAFSAGYAFTIIRIRTGRGRTRCDALVEVRTLVLVALDLDAKRGVYDELDIERVNEAVPLHPEHGFSEIERVVPDHCPVEMRDAAGPVDLQQNRSLVRANRTPVSVSACLVPTRHSP